MKRALALSPLAFVNMFGIGLVELMILGVIALVVVAVPVGAILFFTRKGS